MTEKAFKAKKDRFERSELHVKIIAYVILGGASLIALLPCLNVLAQSFSSGHAVTSGHVYFLPKEFQFDAYWAVLAKSDFLLAMKNSLFVTIIGVLVCMFVSVTFAYPLSREKLYGKKFLTIVCMIAMVFSGGTVPTYLVVRSLGLFNKFASLIIPSCMSIFDMLIIRNYFEQLPDSIMESASLDGATDFQILWYLVLPMSTPVLATVGLLYAIGFWNSYFHAMLYITKPKMITLQVFIRNFISDCGTLVSSLERNEDMVGKVSTANIIACTTVLGVIPIIVIYPFIQKYLAKGMTLGSVKG
ncbi:MAG: carbohydrate ABC transporter permease [Spirochaetales bacterium]|nr:carbohydrate ABC transporter permease [Spirochaetales bacterium]